MTKNLKNDFDGEKTYTKSTHMIKTLNSFLKGDCLYTIYRKVGGGGGDYVSM